MVNCTRCNNPVGDFIEPPIVCPVCSGLGYDVMSNVECSDCNGLGIIQLEYEPICKACYIQEQEDLDFNLIGDL